MDLEKEDNTDDLHPLYENEELLPSFTAEIRLNIRTKEDALEWLEHYKASSYTDWRSAKTFKESTSLLKFKVHFVFQRTISTSYFKSYL